MLVTTHSVCAWGAAYDGALTYGKQRAQFGKPLAGFQIVQERLVRMLAAVTSSSSTACSSPAWRRKGACRTRSPASPRFHNTRTARGVIALARDMLGGNGVLLENHVIRHMGDTEVIHT